MDSLDIGVVIGVIALLTLLIVIAPVAYRYDRRMARKRRCGDDGGGSVASYAGVFGGDGGGGCSDGGGSC